MLTQHVLLPVGAIAVFVLAVCAFVMWRDKRSGVKSNRAKRKNKDSL